jgi:hypothetical protein
MAVTIYTTCSTLNIGCNLYTNSNLTVTASNGIYYDGVTCWVINNGAITSTTVCTTSTTTTTTTAAISTNHFRSTTPQVNITNACAQTTPTNIFTSVASDTMSNGIIFYTDSALNTRFNGASQWFKILWKGAIGFNDIYGVQIDANGVVIDFAFCSAITTTTTAAPTTTTTTTTAPTTTTTSTTTTTTTAAPTTTTTSTTTTTTTSGGGGGTTTTTTATPAYQHGIVYCDTTTDTIISVNSLIRFDYYYDSSANQCFQVVTNPTVVAGPGQLYTSVPDCNDPSCVL